MAGIQSARSSTSTTFSFGNRSNTPPRISCESARRAACSAEGPKRCIESSGTPPPSSSNSPAVRELRSSDANSGLRSTSASFMRLLRRSMSSTRPCSAPNAAWSTSTRPISSHAAQNRSKYGSWCGGSAGSYTAPGRYTAENPASRTHRSSATAAAMSRHGPGSAIGTSRPCPSAAKSASQRWKAFAPAARSCRRVRVVGDREERRRRHPVSVQQHLTRDALGVQLLEETTGVEDAVTFPALEPVELGGPRPLVVLCAQRFEVSAVARLDVLEVTVGRPPYVPVEGEDHEPRGHKSPLISGRLATVSRANPRCRCARTRGLCS